MSFLDNAGTIILDAILTDVGRQRLAQGNFQVTKFALGDDEVDYRLYQPQISQNAPGAWSAFDDPAGYLILSQSCFEALNNTNATINYGLTSFERSDLLYVPELKINYADSASTGYPSVHPGIARPVSGSIFYLAANAETSKKLKSALGSTNYILESQGYSKTKIVIESGIPTDQLDGSLANSQAFIIQPALLDTYYYVYVDSRFFANILSSGEDGIFQNRTNGELEMNFTTFKARTRVSLPTVIDKFDSYIVHGAMNRVYSANNTGALTDRSISAITGPRGTVMALGLTIVNEMGGGSTATRNPKYTIFGKNDQTLFGGSDKYDYIDTTIYVKGAVTGAEVQIPLRIIRYAGT